MSLSNYKDYFEFLKIKYKHSQMYYNKTFDNEDYAKFLFYFENMNVFTMYPRPIVMDLHNLVDDKKVNISDFIHRTLSINKLLEKKINEFFSYTELYEKVQDIRKVRRFFDYEIRDTIKQYKPDSYITNAWTKMTELLYTFELLNINKKEVNTFHICEHPGAFIYSIQDYIKDNNPEMKHNFIFQSLKPNQDKQIFKSEYNLLKNYRDHIDYGQDKTGDITNTNNITYYINKYKKNKYDLITSDCGLDCSDDFNTQEEKLLPIYTGALLTSIGISQKGSNYVFKMFSFQHHRSIELLYLCQKYYEQVYITRLLTTKTSSGEIYIVCLNFKGISQEHLNDLIRKYNKQENFVDEIPEKFAKRLEKYNKFLTYRRITNMNFLLFRIFNAEYIHKNNKIMEYVQESVNYYVNYFLKFIKIK